MANEITVADLVTNGGRVSQVLNQLVLDGLYDPTDLRSLMIPDMGPQGPSATHRGTVLAAPVAAAAASSETSGGGSNTAYTTGKFDLTAARYYLKYQFTDLFGVTSLNAPINIETLVRNLLAIEGLTLTDLLCAAFTNLATSVNQTGNAMSADYFFDAMFALNMNNVPMNGVAAVLSPRQINHLVTSLRGETGAMQWSDATREVISRFGPGYRANWAGVDIWQSDSVNTSSSDKVGAMFGPGCYAYRLSPTIGLDIAPDDRVIDTGTLVVERDRDADNGMTTYYANLYPAVAEAVDLRGVKIITKAGA